MPDLFRGFTGPTAEPEVHLLPQGFTGAVALQHGVPDAPALSYEGAARVYQIDETGQLHTRDSLNVGIRPPGRARYFFVSPDGSGQRTPIPLERDAPTPQTIAILGGYPVHDTFHYFVDTPENRGRYPHPAIDEER
ncbi:MAG: hypothetical protein AAFV53_39190 [Myxococcota bacterium]